MQEILISSLSIPIETLRRRLQPAVRGENIDLVLRKSSSGSRSFGDSAVLVAVVSGTSAAVSALITGLLRLIERHGPDPAAKIVVTGSNGASVTVPADIDPERLEHLIRLAQTLDGPRIRIHGS